MSETTGTNHETWDHRVSVLVVASGARAMTAVLAGHDAGREVLLIEKAHQCGGSSAMSWRRS